MSRHRAQTSRKDLEQAGLPFTVASNQSYPLPTDQLEVYLIENGCGSKLQKEIIACYQWLRSFHRLLHRQRAAENECWYRQATEHVLDVHRIHIDQDPRSDTHQTEALPVSVGQPNRRPSSRESNKSHSHLSHKGSVLRPPYRNPTHRQIAR